jgi:hypothetical protein
MEGLYVIFVLAVLVGLLVSIRRDRGRTRERVGTDGSFEVTSLEPMGDAGSPEAPSHSSHHGDSGCLDTHHGGCDIGGHGGSTQGMVDSTQGMVALMLADTTDAARPRSSHRQAKVKSGGQGCPLHTSRDALTSPILQQ